MLQLETGDLRISDSTEFLPSLSLNVQYVLTVLATGCCFQEKQNLGIVESAIKQEKTPPQSVPNSTDLYFVMAVLLYRQAKASTWFAPLLFLLLGRSLEAKGGEKPTLKLTPFAPTEINYRQDFCTEYKAAVDVENGTFHIENALSGKQLNVVLQYGKIGFPYFNYTDEDGIDPDHPGIVAELLDYVAERGNFTWRDSFGVYSQSDLNYNDGSGVNKTWDDMIVWSAEHYDLSVDKWWVSLCMRERVFDQHKG